MRFLEAALGHPWEACGGEAQISKVPLMTSSVLITHLTVLHQEQRKLILTQLVFQTLIHLVCSEKVLSQSQQ